MSEMTCLDRETEKQPGIDQYLVVMAKYEASDMLLKVGVPPVLRLSGALRELGVPQLPQRELERRIHEILDEPHRRHLLARGDIDLAYGVPGLGRFRINAYHQRGSLSISCRRVRIEIPAFEDLHLPGRTLRRVSGLQQGLVLVAGTTGSGKSTTIAAMLQHLVAHRRCHVITIEDPIEYLFGDSQSYVDQREVGIDVPSFPSALRTVVRQDPDVIFIGEMRDEESFTTALTAAETGHLVFSTVHAAGVPQTIGRILNLFEPARQAGIRQALAQSLVAVVAQKLLPSIREGVDRVPAVEILVSNATARKLIAEGRDRDLGALVRGGESDGMLDFNQSLCKLVAAGLVSREAGLAHSPNPEQLKMALDGIVLSDDRKILGVAG